MGGGHQSGASTGGGQAWGASREHMGHGVADQGWPQAGHRRPRCPTRLHGGKDKISL